MVADVVCDIDNTIAQFTPAMVTAVNVQFGSTYTVGDFTKYPFKYVLTKKQWQWFRHDLKYSPEFLMSLAPYTDAIAALGVMQTAGHKIIIATDRNHPDRITPPTKRWLDTNNVPYDEFISLGDETKMTLAAQYHASGEEALLFDDDPRKIQFWPSAKTPLWMPRRPYTPDTVPANVTVFETWNTPLAALGLRTFKSFSSSHTGLSKRKYDTFIL